MKKIADIRKEYTLKELSIEMVAPNPFAQFESWFNEVLAAEVLEPNAVFLATASKAGIPSGRVVLLKGIEKNQLVFFTNYESQKGKELAENPVASLTFFWAELERQVRVVGEVKRMDESYSTNYFHSRPFESQLGAWASQQSSKIASRTIIEQNFESLKEKYQGKEIPKPAFWGGYGLQPHIFEFWQGRASRLHDRIFYEKSDKNNWVISRLAP
ncbi:MAG: pyridoxamine 5'-phosphate oxidase [Thermonemataceae bacterium]